nr:XylR N-terminal domain-containing protein [Salinibacillus kushneri]
MVTPSSSLRILREQLVKNIGIERISDFLFQFGWEMVVREAKKTINLKFPTPLGISSTYKNSSISICRFMVK